MKKIFDAILIVSVLFSLMLLFGCGSSGGSGGSTYSFPNYWPLVKGSIISYEATMPGDPPYTDNFICIGQGSLSDTASVEDSSFLGTYTFEAHASTDVISMTMGGGDTPDLYGADRGLVLLFSHNGAEPVTGETYSRVYVFPSATLTVETTILGKARETLQIGTVDVWKGRTVASSDYGAITIEAWFEYGLGPVYYFIQSNSGSITYEAQNYFTPGNWLK